MGFFIYVNHFYFFLKRKTSFAGCALIAVFFSFPLRP